MTKSIHRLAFATCLALFLLLCLLSGSVKRGTESGRSRSGVLNEDGAVTGPNSLKTVTVTVSACGPGTTHAIDLNKPLPQFLPFGSNPLDTQVDRPLSSHRDIRLEHPHKVDANVAPAPNASKSNSRRYSHFRCLGNDNHYEAFAERICVFQNVCYNIASQEIRFFRRSYAPARPVIFDAELGEIADFNSDKHGFVALHQTTDMYGADFGNTWGPAIYSGASPAAASPSTTLSLETPHVIFSNWASDDNLGHVLWEELAGIWYAMVRMNVLNSKIIPMHGPEDLPDRPLAVKFRRSFVAAITSAEPVSMHPYLHGLAKAKGVKDVCFDELLVGGNVRRFLHKFAWHNEGHEPLFYSLRSRVLRSFGLDPQFVPSSHRIIVTNKTASNFHPDSRLRNHRSFYNLEEIVAFLKREYPTVEVTVVEWHKHQIREQLLLMQSATILLSPSGGVSMMIPFLSEGAHAIILDYWSTKDSWLLGTKAGQSVSMEAPFWNHWPHVRKLYYQVRSLSEMRPDNPEAEIDKIDVRDEASVFVDLNRLKSLINTAFENMAP